MKYQKFTKTRKLSGILWMLAGVCGAVEVVEARTSYMITGHQPSCAVCHKTNKTGGLEVGLQPSGNYGPYAVWDGGDAVSKGMQYCADRGRVLNFQTWACEKQNVNRNTSAVGGLVETDNLGEKYSANAATDIWSVTCPADASQLTVSVRDNPPKNPALIGIQIKKGDAASPISIDSSEASPYSSEITLPAGPGVYEVLVNKSASSKKGLENYSAKIACKSLSNETIGIDSIEKTQDQ